MSDTAWLALATIGAAVLTFIGVLLTLRKQRKEISDIHAKVGNGFTSEVIDYLGRIQGSVDKLDVGFGILNRRVNQHIKQHAQGVLAKNPRL